MNSVNVELADNFERQQDVVERAGLSVSPRDFLAANKETL